MPSTSTADVSCTEDNSNEPCGQDDQVSIMEGEVAVGPEASQRERVSRKRTQNAMAEEAFQVMKSLRQGYQNRDEYQHFGDLIACKIRKLNTDYAKITVQHMIFNILHDAQNGKYDYPTNITNIMDL